MSSVERELWDIFTTYTLFANAHDPFHISYNTMSRLCRDCGLFDLDAFPGFLTEADLYVLFVREARVVKDHRRSHNSAGSGQPPPVPYGVFLTLLLRISERLFTPAWLTEDARRVEQNPNLPPPFTPQQCLQKLLMEHVFVDTTEHDKLRQARPSIRVAELLRVDKVTELFHFFKDPLQQLFDFYCQLSATAVTRHTNVAKRGTFHRHFEMQQPKGSPRAQRHARAALTERTLGYEQYLQFAREMGLGSLISISMVDLGDAYLTTITPKTTAGMLDVKRMNFRQFWECLVRWAVLAQKGRAVQEEAAVDEKMKSMFLEMWFHLQESIPCVVGDQHLSPPTVGNGSKAVFIQACQALNERFVRMWAKDGYRVYLAPPENQPMDAAMALQLAIQEMRALADVRKDPHGSIAQYLKMNLAAAREDVLIEVEGESSEQLGDPRLTVEHLNRLLSARPECAKYLFAQLKSLHAGA